MKRILSLAFLICLCSSITSFAYGWEQRQDGAWMWKDKQGHPVYDEWKAGSDGTYYYIGNDGIMEVGKFVESDDNLYYVDELGRMVCNRWIKAYDDESEMERWYYFRENGKAYKATSQDKATLREIDSKKYIFDENGCMVYGWVNSDGTMVDAEDPAAWRKASYYCGSEAEGNVTIGWKRLQVDYSNDPDEVKMKNKWFYFKETGKKTVKAVVFVFPVRTGLSIFSHLMRMVL